MSGLDIAIGIVLVFFIALGTWRGFVREALSLITWVLACVAAWLFADKAGGLYAGVIADPALRLVAGFVSLFVVVFIIGSVAGFIAHKLVSTKQALKVSNHILGACTGLARGVVVIVIVFLLAGLTSIPQYDWWRDSRLAPYFQSLAMFTMRFLPEDIARHIRYG